MKLDSRTFSQKAYVALMNLRGEAPSEQLPENCLEAQHYKKATSLIQGLPSYISTWGLHRLSGDMQKFLNGTAENTIYKGKVYHEFLTRLQTLSEIDFDPEDEGTLINLDLKRYTALNHLALKLAKEWSFWASAILGEEKE